MKEIKLTINGSEYSVTIEKFGSEEAKVVVNGTNYTVGLADLGIERAAREGNIIPTVSSNPTPVDVVVPKAAPRRKKASTPKPVAMHYDESTAVLAPLPGLIMNVLAEVGDEIKSGQNVVIMEAMKMENHIPSNITGVVTEIRVKTGDTVPEGHALMILE